MSRIIRIHPENLQQDGRRCVRARSAPTLWEDALDRQLSEARAACLQGLRRIPTGLGRLAYLAILQHRLLEDHEELFSEFCSCSLQQKYEWLFRLLAGAIHGGTLPDEWRTGSAYLDLIPRTAESEARERYLTEIEVALQIATSELAGNLDRQAKNARCLNRKPLAH